MYQEGPFVIGIACMPAQHPLQTRGGCTFEAPPLGGNLSALSPAPGPLHGSTFQHYLFCSGGVIEVLRSDPLGQGIPAVALCHPILPIYTVSTDPRGLPAGLFAGFSLCS